MPWYFPLPRSDLMKALYLTVWMKCDHTPRTRIQSSQKEALLEGAPWSGHMGDPLPSTKRSQHQGPWNITVCSCSAAQDQLGSSAELGRAGLNFTGLSGWGERWLGPAWAKTASLGMRAGYLCWVSHFLSFISLAHSCLRGLRGARGSRENLKESNVF